MGRTERVESVAQPDFKWLRNCLDPPAQHGPSSFISPSGLVRSI